MPGLGTIINVVLLVAGGLLGLAGGRFITPRIQDTLMKASGLCVLFIGLGGTMQKMLLIDGKALATTGTTMLIVSFALGSLIGEAVNLEAAIENLGEWLKRKTGSEGDNEFTNAVVSTSLTVCIGAMAIVGSIQDGLLGDWSTLALKGALDCIIVCTMTASLGRGCIFSALPVAVFQGTITLFAGALSPIMTTAALDSLSLVGSMLICEMAAYYRSIGSSIKEELERIYAEYGRYLNKVNSYEFPGLSGMETMAGIMTKLRENPPAEFAGYKVVTVADYKARTKTDVATGKTEPIELPAANVLIYTLAGGASVVVRPSGTEPKIKTYFTTLGKDLAEAEAQQKALAAAVEPLLK